MTTAHYVDCSSGDDDNSGASADSAWRTLAKVSSTTLQAGHAVYFRRGCTFDGGVEIDGTGRADSPVLVTAYGTGSAPVLRNSKGPSWGAVVEVLGSHVVVDGLTLRDAPAAGVRLEEGTTGSVIRNLSISATGFGVYTNGSHHLITRNRVSALHMAVNTPGGDDDNGAVGFPVNGTDVEVSYNECNGCRAPSHDYGTDGGFTEVYNSGDRLFVHHNRAVDCAGFIEFGADSGPRQANGVRIGYNVIENVGYVVTVNSDNAFGIRVDNVRFENNTVVQTEKVNTMFVFPKATASSMNWRNNVFYVGDGSSVWWDEAPFLRSNNVYFTTAGSRLGLSPGSGDIVADPQFVDRARHDYRLRASSPAVNAGQRIDGYARDFLGRVLSGAPDIGAYER